MAGEHDLTPLLELDQLRRAQRCGDAFSELTEPTLTFKPTYKLVPGRRGEYTARWVARGGGGGQGALRTAGSG